MTRYVEVWKFPLTGGYNDIPMPENAKVLHVGTQFDQIVMWAVVDPAEEKVMRRFLVVGTGHPFKLGGTTYCGTTQIDLFVFHVFEEATL